MYTLYPVSKQLVLEQNPIGYAEKEAGAVIPQSPAQMAVNELSSRQCCGPLNIVQLSGAAARRDLYRDVN